MRARALMMLMLFTALRISEAVALDVDDVRILTRKGQLVVLGKGEVQREVPLNALVRQVLDAWLEQRTEIAAAGERALREPHRRPAVRALGRSRCASRRRRRGPRLSAHTLRHTCLTGLLRRGNDLVMVAELAGHQKLETTRRYTLPSAADSPACWGSERIEALVGRIEAIDGVRFLSAKRNWPQIQLAPLAEPSNRQQFTAILEDALRALNAPA